MSASGGCTCFRRVFVEVEHVVDVVSSTRRVLSPLYKNETAESTRCVFS